MMDKNADHSIPLQQPNAGLTLAAPSTQTKPYEIRFAASSRTVRLRWTDRAFLSATGKTMRLSDRTSRPQSRSGNVSRNPGRLPIRA